MRMVHLKALPSWGWPTWCSSIAAILLAACYGFESQCHLPNNHSGISLTRHEENGRGCGRKGRGMVERGSKGRGWGIPPSSRFTRRGRGFGYCHTLSRVNTAWLKQKKKSIADTENWLNWNGDLDNPNESEDDWEADAASDLEPYDGIEDPESP